MKQRLKYDWEFQKLPVKDGVIPDRFEENAFYNVVVPHDWLIGQAENLYEDSVGWYRKRIELNLKRSEIISCALRAFTWIVLFS